MTISLQTTACAFDVDAANLVCLEVALPGWEIRILDGMTAASLPRDWNSAEPSLLVVAIRDDALQSLKLCRFLAGGHRLSERLPESAPALKAMLFVLLPPERQSLVWAMQEAGADRCLFLPLDGDEVADLLYAGRSRDPNPSLRDREEAQNDNRWRDDGGSG